MRHLISPLDLSQDEVSDLLNLAEDIYSSPEKYSHCCTGKKLATLFYEPSTRTRLSFEAAMLNLGGSVLGFSSADSSSASKGESVADTIRIISCYADICAMRHPKEGAPLVASMHSSIPVINAGDGGHNHPTQTLTDLLTIKNLKGHLDGLTIGFCGDLKFGRTVHSLINAMVRYPNTKFVLISPKELQIPAYLKEETLDVLNIPYEETSNLEEALLKGIRSLEIGANHMYLSKFDNMSVEELLDYITEFRSDNIFAIAELIYHGVSLEKIHEITMITPYFLEAIKNIIDMEEKLRVCKDVEILTAAKKMGFSDKYIARLWNCLLQKLHF